MNYLVDTSALVRIWRNEVDSVWRAVASDGLIMISEPALAEMMVAVKKTEYSDVEDELRETYPYALVPDNIWDLVAIIRRALVPYGVHKALSLADLVIAATAIRQRLIVLHEDKDFETAARYLPQLRQQRISVGPE